MNIREFIDKLRSLSDQKKKLVILIIVVVLSFAFGFFWIRSATERLNKLSEATKDIKLPEIDLPKVELPNNQIQGTEIADWKTYRNTEYSFEVEYPANWTFRVYNSGVAFRPNEKPNDIDYEFINVSFVARGEDYCKIPFEDYVKKAGIYEIQNFESLNEFKELKTVDGLKIYQARWNFLSVGDNGNTKISLPITYFGIDNKNLCGGVEAFLNNEEYLDIYNKMILTFKFITK
jgi:hypothetical protein